VYRRAVPRRTNTFQDVVAIVQRHMAGTAAVEESAMVTPTAGGDAREVDVMVTSEIAGHRVAVAIEASKTARPSTVEWVERMIGKHLDLPSDKLVLYSGSGFTKAALKKATDKNIAAITEEELTSDELRTAVLGGLRSLWPKSYSLTPVRARVSVEKPDGSTVWFKAPEDIILFGSDGRELGPNLKEAVTAHLEQNLEQIGEQIGIRDIEESIETDFVAVLRPVRLRIGGQDTAVWLRFDDADPVEFHRLVQVTISGHASIQVAKVDFTHARLGSVTVAYGDFELGDRTGLAVATGTTDGGTISLRFTGDPP
jgi:hypothetical protein